MPRKEIVVEKNMTLLFAAAEPLALRRLLPPPAEAHLRCLLKESERWVVSFAFRGLPDLLSHICLIRLESRMRLVLLKRYIPEC